MLIAERTEQNAPRGTLLFYHYLFPCYPYASVIAPSAYMFASVNFG